MIWLAIVMTASSLAVKFVGLPRQIAVNQKRRSAPHAMRWFAVLGTLSYGSQTLWSVLRCDWPLAVAQAPGVIMAAVLLWQILVYADTQ